MRLVVRQNIEWGRRRDFHARSGSVLPALHKANFCWEKAAGGTRRQGSGAPEGTEMLGTVELARLVAIRYFRF